MAFITPSFIGALGWILLAAPNSGWLNVWLRQWLGGDSPLNIYTDVGAVFVCAVYTVPFTFTIVATALDEMAVELEDASAMLGGGILRTMRSVTLPLVMPAIVAGFILSFIQGMTLFGVPAFLLTPARVPVVTTKLAEFYQMFPPELNLAAACHAVAAMTGGLFFLRRRIPRPPAVRHDRRQGARIAAGRAGPLALAGPAGRAAGARGDRVPAVCLADAGVAQQGLGSGALVGQPDAALVSLGRAGQPANPVGHRQFLLYATMAATVCLLLGVVVAYMVERKLFRGAWALGATASVPIIIRASCCRWGSSRPSPSRSMASMERARCWCWPSWRRSCRSPIRTAAPSSRPSAPIWSGRRASWARGRSARSAASRCRS